MKQRESKIHYSNVTSSHNHKSESQRIGTKIFETKYDLCPNSCCVQHWDVKKPTAMAQNGLAQILDGLIRSNNVETKAQNTKNGYIWLIKLAGSLVPSTSQYPIVEPSPTQKTRRVLHPHSSSHWHVSAQRQAVEASTLPCKAQRVS